MKKKVSLIIVLMITLVLLTSCTGGSYVITIGKIKGNSKSLTGSYNSFSGKYYSRVKLEAGDIIEYKASCNTDSGSLQLVLLDKDNNVIANLLEAQDVEINNTGYYYFTALGEDHKGDFSVQWKVN